MKSLTRSSTTRLVGFLLAALSVQAAEATCNNAIAATTPTSRFSVGSDPSIVTDSKTGLQWQRCPVGTIYVSGRCNGTPSGFAQNIALDTASKAGSGWRLPNVKELASIVERQCFTPAINFTVFPDSGSYSYWTSSDYVNGGASQAWYVDFNAGIVSILARSAFQGGPLGAIMVARLVRNSQ